jgi:hypothetical protein
VVLEGTLIDLGLREFISRGKVPVLKKFLFYGKITQSFYSDISFPETSKIKYIFEKKTQKQILRKKTHDTS